MVYYLRLFVIVCLLVGPKAARMLLVPGMNAARESEN